jgi:hypothetical protein
MLQVDGIQPKLYGHICEALICQQYWYQGKLADEVDVLFVQADGRCHQLYFDNGTVFWRYQQDVPKPFDPQPGDVFAYPLIDLGEKYRLKGQLITGLDVEPVPAGAKVSITFETGAVLVIYHQDNRSSLRYRPA